MPRKPKDKPEAAPDTKPEAAPVVAGGALPAFTMPDGEEKKKRRRRTTKPKVEPLVDFQLPVSALMITATEALAGFMKQRGMEAKRAECWRMSDKEAEDFERTFNWYCTKRAPQLEKWYPEIALAVSLGNYALRAAAGISPDIADEGDGGEAAK